MKLTSSDYLRAWQTIEGQKTDFGDGWKLVERGDEVFLGAGPQPELVVPFYASVSVDEGRLYVVIAGNQISMSSDAIEALLNTSKRA